MIQNKVNETIKKIGIEKLAPPLFYTAPVGLRFEIGSPQIDVYNNFESEEQRTANPIYVDEALKRAETIYKKLPGGFDCLINEIFPAEALIYESGDNLYDLNEAEFCNKINQSEAEQIENFCKLTKLLVPADIERKETLSEDGEKIPSTVCYYSLDNKEFDFSSLMKTIILSDIGGTDIGDVYFVNTDENIVFHLYDDRGLDVVSDDMEILRPLNEEFDSWLLDYDRLKMDDLFKQK